MFQDDELKGRAMGLENVSDRIGMQIGMYKRLADFKILGFKIETQR